MTSDGTVENARRRPKGDKRARTRAALLQAARELVREKGYDRTTLEDVAKRAGMTSGAIYGNFKNRDELFIALSESFWAPIAPEFKAGSSFAEKMRALAEATLAAIPERRLAAVGYLTGRAYALSQDALRARVHEITARDYDAGAAWVRTVAEDTELPMPPEILVRVAHALTEGLVLHRLLTPELIPDEVFYAAFAALAVKPVPTGQREASHVQDAQEQDL